MTILSGQFDFSVLLPVTVIIAISALVPMLLSIFRIKFIPAFVIEIIIGIIIGVIYEDKSGFHTDLVEGLYTIGMAFLLFMSGLDTDFSVLKKEKQQNKLGISPIKLCIVLISGVLLLSFLASFLFKGYIKTDMTSGILLLTVCFSSSFASIIVPIIHQEHLHHTTIGKIICTYSTISELLTVILLSVFMIYNGINHDQKPYLLIFGILLLIITYIVEKYIDKSKFREQMGSFCHLSLRVVILVFLVLILLCQYSGAEFILGAYLAGMVIKAANVSKETTEKLDVVAYGIFIPMFYIIIGLHIPFIELIENPRYLLLILELFLVLNVVKLPFLYLAKWYKMSTVFPTMSLITCTIIVSITLEHFGVFTSEFMACLIIASTLTCLISPIIFEVNKKFNVFKNQSNDIKNDVLESSIME